MEISPITLIRLLLYSVIWGAIIGCLFDINKAIRVFFDIDSEKSKVFFDKILLNKKLNFRTDLKMFKYKNQVETAVIFAQDLLTIVIYVIGLLFINFSLNKGVFRFFSISASIIGVIFFKFTFGKVILMILEWLCYKIKIGILFVFSFIYRPIIQISSKICEICKKNYMFLKKSIAKQIKKRYNIYKKKSLNKMAISAFLEMNSFFKME